MKKEKHPSKFEEGDVVEITHVPDYVSKRSIKVGSVATVMGASKHVPVVTVVFPDGYYYAFADDHIKLADQ